MHAWKRFANARKGPIMQLEPYLFFYGKCEEALKFYASALGGEITQLMRMSEAPPEMQMPGIDPNSVMHATFKAGAISFMASDGNPATEVHESNISLSLGADNETEARKAFDGLAAGGKITMPFADAFWGGKFGQLTDKFGIDWMIVSPS
jgi:PhnB protein